MAYLVGSYAAVAPDADSTQGSHADLVAALGELASVGGLELPYQGALPTVDRAFRSACRDDWSYVVTSFPDTMLRLGGAPGFGLASPEEDGRRLAVAHARGIRDAVAGLHDDLGRGAVLAVELHSAPTQRASGAALKASLEEVAEWDWSGASVTIEHCDAWTTDHPVQKGFLALEDELEAIGAASVSDADVGLTVNWARSVIEARDASAAADHVKTARAAGLLRGVVFSGCSAVDDDYGEAWLDAHLAPSVESVPGFEDLPTLTGPSLLGPREVAECLDAAGDDLLFVGLKIGLRPVSLSLGERVERIGQSLMMLDRVVAG